MNFQSAIQPMHILNPAHCTCEDKQSLPARVSDHLGKCGCRQQDVQDTSELQAREPFTASPAVTTAISALALLTVRPLKCAWRQQTMVFARPGCANGIELAVSAEAALHSHTRCVSIRSPFQRR